MHFLLKGSPTFLIQAKSRCINITKSFQIQSKRESTSEKKEPVISSLKITEKADDLWEIMKGYSCFDWLGNRLEEKCLIKMNGWHIFEMTIGKNCKDGNIRRGQTISKKFMDYVTWIQLPCMKLRRMHTKIANPWSYII